MYDVCVYIYERNMALDAYCLYEDGKVYSIVLKVQNVITRLYQLVSMLEGQLLVLPTRWINIKRKYEN